MLRSASFRRSSLVLGALLVLAAAQPARALDAEPFSEERFRALQSENALILVDVAADWCPTCAVQSRIMTRFQERHPEVSLQVLQVDFDKQKKWVRHFKAPRQSTLILYRGDERVWFSVAETDEEAIFQAIRDAAAS